MPGTIFIDRASQDMTISLNVEEFEVCEFEVQRHMFMSQLRPYQQLDLQSSVLQSPWTSASPQ